MQSERRHERVEVADASIGVEVWSQQISPMGRFTGIITVLGAGGGFVRTDKHLDIGHPIGLRFSLPASGEEIVCGGMVRDSRPGQGVGVEFTALTPLDHERVNTAVRRFRSGRTLTSVPRPSERRGAV